MAKLDFFNAIEAQVQEERVYGKKFLEILYKEWWCIAPIRFLVTRCRFFSALYGWAQKQPFSKKKVAPFIKEFAINTAEFEKTDFDSFNDFFIRKLKKEARPIDPNPNTLIFPCDGRFRYLPKPEMFSIKNQTFSPQKLLAGHFEYTGGPILLARLAPLDYHRFHFPCDCTPSESILVDGPLDSVSPLANKLSALFTNRRHITQLHSEKFGTLYMVEIGATNVGSITQTFTARAHVKKGDEKGYFSFGGSAIALVLEPRPYTIYEPLITNSLEVYSHFGHTLLSQP